MTGSSHLDIAEDVALVTFLMSEAILSRDESLLPDGGRFHVFDGFPGFCDHCAAAGLALHRMFRPFDVDQWLNIVDGFAAGVVGYAVDHGRAADAKTLTLLARTAAVYAIEGGLAHGRSS